MFSISKQSSHLPYEKMQSMRPSIWSVLHTLDVNYSKPKVLGSFPNCWGVDLLHHHNKYGKKNIVIRISIYRRPSFLRWSAMTIELLLHVFQFLCQSLVCRFAIRYPFECIMFVLLFFDEWVWIFIGVRITPDKTYRFSRSMFAFINRCIADFF